MQGRENKTLLPVANEENPSTLNFKQLNGEKNVMLYKDQINVSRWTQFSTIFRKTLVCSLRHRVNTKITTCHPIRAVTTLTGVQLNGGLLIVVTTDFF